MEAQNGRIFFSAELDCDVVVVDISGGVRSGPVLFGIHSIGDIEVDNRGRLWDLVVDRYYSDSDEPPAGQGRPAIGEIGEGIVERSRGTLW